MFFPHWNIWDCALLVNVRMKLFLKMVPLSGSAILIWCTSVDEKLMLTRLKIIFRMHLLISGSRMQKTMVLIVLYWTHNYRGMKQLFYVLLPDIYAKRD